MCIRDSLGGVLPIEEFTFFLITTTLLTFGVTLLLAEESHRRFAAIRRWLSSRRLSVETEAR